MDVIHERCAGLDVHKETVVGCLRGQNRGEVRRFATTTAGLLELSDWLRHAGCTHVAMEATGVYFALSSALIGRVEVPPALG